MAEVEFIFTACGSVAALRSASIPPTILLVKVDRGFSVLSSISRHTPRCCLSAANLPCFLEGTSAISFDIFAVSPVGSGAAKSYPESCASLLYPVCADLNTAQKQLHGLFALLYLLPS